METLPTLRSIVQALDYDKFLISSRRQRPLPAVVSYTLAQLIKKRRSYVKCSVVNIHPNDIPAFKKLVSDDVKLKADKKISHNDQNQYFLPVSTNNKTLQIKYEGDQARLLSSLL